MRRKADPATDTPAGLGRKGEELARAHLVAQGFRIVATDWRLGHWQADILAWDGATPVVVEVKSRRGPARPETGFGPAQAARLLQIGQAFFQGKGGPVRLDLVTVRHRPGRPPQVDHFPDLRLL